MNGTQIGLTIATLLASILTAILVLWANIGATRQREEQGKREEWWRRFTWATELAIDIDAARANVGVVVLTRMARSPLASDDDLRVADAVLEQVLGIGDTGLNTVEGGQQ